MKSVKFSRSGPKMKKEGGQGGGVLCGIFCPIKSFMVGKTRDCNLQSIKITFYSAHWDYKVTAAFGTVFRTAHSQNKKCKLNTN